MRLTYLFLTVLILAGPAGWSQEKPKAPKKPKKKSGAKKLDERFSTPKNTYLTWRKALDAKILSEEWNLLPQCYSNNPAWLDRDGLLNALVEFIKTNQLEFSDAKISGDRADVILKNNSGKTVTLGFVKEGDSWHLDSLPDMRPIYKKLLNPYLIVSFCVLILLFALWRRRAVLKAIERAKPEK
ncbi:MAG: hypothetical protein GXP25_08245 [Planctomycetes bacterium]|nr:hypothetical protein [Planctomycetota bacterium]